ncbi:sulfite exporter TauE/SafE family protein [Roseateles amylovorans]|uniref:Probable membrane transporter protein n=1 Tax=Roseateles amylovorans TaxID=2978473 RepID=A0ABY6AVN6_9BURK|nr:sulfite exporter TauE/SafE family protein [Roseateles amylovorans]UXH76927.1 sulfite exporter TauE/SafE family protein [Roseateles amylovorans]
MDYLLFGLCAGVAAYVQTLTGFAFALVLLGLTASLQLGPVGCSADAASLLVLLNVAAYLRHHPVTPAWRVVLPALPSSAIGVAAGLLLLHWLSAQAGRHLAAALGVTIMVCAGLMLIPRRAKETPSGPLGYAVAGACSGLLGGLFSAAGPPLVLHMYRQPLPVQVVQQCLMLATAFNSALRLLMVAGTGHLSTEALWLALAAAPMVLIVHAVHRRYPPPLNAQHIRRLAALLLGGAGLLLALRA